MMIGPRPEAVAEAEGKIKTADALVAFSRAHLDYHTIRAPIDGVLDSLTCHPGQTIAIGSPIGEVVDTRQVFASIWLPPRSASSVRVGQAARVRPADARDPSPDASADEEEEMAGQGRVRGPGGRPADGQPADPRPGGQPAGAAHHRAVGPGVDHRGRAQGRAPGPGRRRSSTWARGRSCTWSGTGSRSCSIPRSGRRTGAGWRSRAPT